MQQLKLPLAMFLVALTTSSVSGGAGITDVAHTGRVWLRRPIAFSKNTSIEARRDNEQATLSMARDAGWGDLNEIDGIVVIEDIIKNVHRAGVVDDMVIAEYQASFPNGVLKYAIVDCSNLQSEPMYFDDLNELGDYLRRKGLAGIPLLLAYEEYDNRSRYSYAVIVYAVLGLFVMLCSIILLYRIINRCWFKSSRKNNVLAGLSHDPDPTPHRPSP